MHHGSFYFYISSGIEEFAQLLNNASAGGEDLARAFIGNQIEIALAIPQFDIAQAVPFFGQGQERLGEQEKLFHMNG